MLRATNLHQPRKFDTYAVGDVGDIEKVWWFLPAATVTVTLIMRHRLVVLVSKVLQEERQMQ